MDKTLERCRLELPASVFSKELIEQVFVQPYCKIQFIVDAGIAKRQTASAYLRALEQLGILIRHKAGREVIYLYPDLLKVLST